jgi:multiple sugar transport system substrate-binding protein
MSRRAWRALAPAALAMLALSCAPRHAAKPHELSFWVAWPVEAIQPLARRFEAENPGIHVNLVGIPWGSGGDSIAAAVKAGAPPDLCQLHGRQLPGFMATNALSDWSAGVADLRPGLRGWEMCMLGDAIYALPWLLRTQLLLYNKSLLARAGLDSARAPDTWDELRTAATRVHRLHGGVHGYGVPDGTLLRGFMPYAWSNDGELLSAGLDSSRFDSPENVQALEFLASLRAVGLVASEDSLAGEFVAGRLGLLLAPLELAVRAAQAGAPDVRVGVALVPRPAADRGAHASLAGGEVLASFTASRRKEDALKLARFLVRPENAHALATALQFVQPATLGADTTAWYRARPVQQLVFQQYETARFLPNFRGRIALEDTLETLLAEALRGRRTAAETVALADTFIAKHVGGR